MIKTNVENRNAPVVLVVFVVGGTHLDISSSDIFNLLKRMVQFWARRPSITDRIFDRPFPIKRKSSMEPSFCK